MNESISDPSSRSSCTHPSSDTSTHMVVRDLASQCVKCGLCLPHCPTYATLKDENESPRGRIELLKALAEDQLALTPKVQTHLNQCLSCRACERVCPAKVEYGKLITKGRAMIKQHPQSTKAHSLTSILLSYIVARPKLLAALHWLLWFIEISKIRAITSKINFPQLIGLGKLNQFLPTVSKPISFKSFYPAIGARQGSVGLFLGCIQKLTDPEIYTASLRVLTHLGYDVHIPKTQSCCAAIALHSGNTKQANELIEKNVNAFEKLFDAKVDYVVSLATGCGTTLKDYPDYIDAEKTQTGLHHSFATKVVDISSLVLRSTWPVNLKLKNFEKKIALHSPCTLKNVWQTSEHAEHILKRIPGAEISLIKDPFCCGAAGTYMVDFTEISESLVDKIIDELKPMKVDILATSNIGCALHLQQTFKRYKLPIHVTHPIVILSNLIIF